MFKHTDFPYWFKMRGEEGRKVLRERMIEAFITNNGNLQKTWDELGITAFTWYQYVHKLGIKEQIVSLRQAFGTPRRGKAWHSEMTSEARPRAASVFGSSGPSA